MSGMVDSAENREVQSPAVLPPNEISTVYIYPGQFSRSSAGEDLSVLVIMKNGDVYGKGRNTLVGWRGKSQLPMKVGGDDVLKEFVKIDQLSGLRLKKIVVGLGFGTALSDVGELYVWGTGRKMLVLHREFLAFQSYDTLRKSCLVCYGNHHASSSSVCGFRLAQCPYSNWYRALEPGGADKGFAKTGSVPFCHRCGEPCSEKLLNTYRAECKLCLCEPCDLLQQVKSTDSLKAWSPPHKEYSGILDVDCGFGFVCTLSELKEVKVRSWKDGCMFELPVHAPENQTFVAVACGLNHVAAVSESGTLYAFGDCNKEIIVDVSPSITLREVKLTGPVTKVCCGDKTTVCLMDDLSVIFIRSGTPVARLNNGPSEIIRGIQFVDDFIMRTEGFMLTRSSLYGESEFISMLVASLNGDQCAELADPVRPRQLSNVTTTSLHGQKLLSDLTLKLADGEIAVHQVVLYSNSSYFKKLFTNKDSIGTVLDVSSYNPKAYRRLLQHFYQADLDDLEAGDLADLCNLAHSYDEHSITCQTLNELTPLLQLENVLPILVKAQSSGNKALIEECENFISSPAYKDWVLKAILIKPLKFIEPLQSVD